jgi:hypothetical protein
MNAVRLRVLVLVTLALTLSACSTSRTGAPTTTAPPAKPLPAVNVSATPAGWVPVADGDVQISVPATWWVLYNSGCPTGSPPGEVLVNPFAACPAEETGGEGPKNVVWLTVMPGLEIGYEHPRAINIGGFSAYDDLGTYVVPSVDLELVLSGPLGQRVLHTISRSPRTVALASGSAPAVPSSWRSVTFAGLRFSVPPSWIVRRTNRRDICGTDTVALSWGVTLDTDENYRPAACHPRLQYPVTPFDGVRVDLVGAHGPTGSFSAGGVCLHRGDVTSCASSTPTFGVLLLRVMKPRRSKPVYVSIGLAGNGIVARTILYSLRSA